MTIVSGLVCWKCGAGVAHEPQPLSRTAQCKACRADLHVCRMCVYFDIRVANSCREPVVDPIVEKDRSNFCGYFQPKPGCYVPGTDSSRAMAELGALFGGGPVTTGPVSSENARKQLDALFGSKAAAPGKAGVTVKVVKARKPKKTVE